MTKTVARTHTFTESGLGAAPFRFLGVRENWFSPAPGVASKPGGCCAHCSTGILYEHVIESADGKVSTVGSECIKKAGDRGLIDAVKAEKRRQKAEARRAEHVKRHEQALAAQRERNGGLTDAELRERQRAEDIKREDARRDLVRAKLEPVAKDLDQANGAFAAQIAHSIRCGDVPRGRGKSIVAEICAKLAGRKGSAAYTARAEQVSVWLDEAEAIE